jgi:hypothetical protein
MENKKIQSFNKLNRDFQKITEITDFLLYLRFLSILKNTRKLSSKNNLKMLSVQINNYLKGFDLDEIYKTSSKENQEKFNAIKHLIEPTALRILEKDNEIAEVIFRTAMITLILFKCRHEEKWTKSIEFSNIEKILLKNNARYKNLDDIDKYFDIVAKFNERYGK